MMTYYKEGLDLPAQVGNYLRSERKKRKMTQERFAELANVDVRTVRSWEKGQFYSFGPLETILFTFQVSIGDVFSNGEDVPSHNFKNEKRTYRMNAILVSSFFACMLTYAMKNREKCRKPERSLPGQKARFAVKFALPGEKSGALTKSGKAEETRPVFIQRQR